jgi:predicted transcriptional regulator
MQKIIPTDAELEILQLLWEYGPCSVRFIHEKLAANKEIGYTTTLKTMQIMNEKGITTRNTNQRTHIYFANIQEDATKGNLLNDFLKSTFNGSTRNLVMHALGNNKVSEQELEEIKALINKIEKP